MAKPGSKSLSKPNIARPGKGKTKKSTTSPKHSQKRLPKATKDNEDHRIASRKFVFKAVVHKVRPDVIRRQWTRLSDSSREEVMRSLSAAAFEVTNSVTGDKKKKEAQETMSAVIQLLERRLRRLPVPPTAKERNFQYEKMLEINALLEGDMVANLERIAKLENEITSEELQLKNDQEYLGTLKENAKQHEKLRSKQQRKLRKVIKDPIDSDGERDDSETINLVDIDEIDLEATEDKDVMQMMTRLGPHLTMMNNTISGVEEALALTRRVADALRTRRR
ncbi:CENP-Q, a CENPA-CAD centromere complex subunit-domain-containing protein [Lipomyces arxii]|uniref:CENP-Q, a CENPA-CAD centromere complex subunit-domain-containing protein n=1 Tax=Lipomyces arxii TaxID=56418 RepID=UPI0034CED872